MGAKYPRKRPITAKEAAKQFGVSVRTIREIIAQPRAEYLAEHTTNRDKPWEGLCISRSTWYRRRKREKEKEKEQSSAS
jgi:transcription initiation factor IIE alpha subunit